MEIASNLLSRLSEPKAPDVNNLPTFNRDDYYEVMLNDFLLNAGVVGLIRMFEYADNHNITCKNGNEYIMLEQSLFIKRSFLEEADIAKLFIDTLVDTFGENTKFARIMKQREHMDALYAEPKPDDKAWVKQVNEICSALVDYLKGNSIKSAFVILQKDGVTDIPTQEDIKRLRTESDPAAKRACYNGICDMLCMPQTSYVLKFKGIQYTLMNMFYADNKGNGAAFFNQREIPPQDAYRAAFITPLQEKPKGKLSCIQCGAEASTDFPLSRFVDMADDLGKKKSYYWNKKPDAYVCSLCAFVYSVAPLGFCFFGEDGVFINNNTSVETLMSLASALNENSKTVDAKTKWYQIYNTFVSQKLDTLKHRADNIQVVIRNKRLESYSLQTVTKAIVGVLSDCSRNFNAIKSIVVKVESDYVNIYQSTIENVVYRRNQYTLITKLFRAALNDSSRSDYLYNLLEIQLHQKGGDNMEDRLKRAYIAKKRGEELRGMLTDVTDKESDKDNKLRGLMYALLNAVSLGNRDKFLEIVLRTYSSYGKPVPDIFFTCFSGDDEFKEIGFAFLLGLKSEEKK